MPAPNTAVLEFLATRRSRPAKTLGLPVPDREEVAALLTLAARSPDHGKLEPWRFLVLERAALLRLADAAGARGREIGVEPEKLAKSVMQFGDAQAPLRLLADRWEEARS